MTRQNIDKEIKRRVQAIEIDIPRELEKTIMKELGQIKIPITPMTPMTPGEEQKNNFFRGSLAAAASVFLAGLLLVTLVPSLFRQKQAAIPGAPEEDSVYVDSARVEGVPADTFIINQKDPDMTIVWIEKAPVTTKKR